MTDPTADPSESPATETSEPSAAGAPAQKRGLTVEKLWEVIREVEDPELLLSIVDLGLVYGVELDQGIVTVDLTLTTPACPVGPMIQGQLYHTIMQQSGVLDVEVNLVWDPPWDPKTMASEEVRMMLALGVPATPVSAGGCPPRSLRYGSACAAQHRRRAQSEFMEEQPPAGIPCPSPRPSRLSAPHRWSGARRGDRGAAGRLRRRCGACSGGGAARGSA